MTNTAAKVISGKPVATGGVLFAPRGTTLPATNAAPTTGFTAAGYVAESGLTKSESREFNTIKEWGGLTVKKTQNGYEATFQFAFLEYLNADAAKAVYGDSAVTVTAANTTHGEQIKVTVKGQEAPHLGWVFDMADGDAVTRITIGDGQITEVGDTAFATSDAAVREVTVTCYPDANGVLFTELSDDGVKTTGGA